MPTQANIPYVVRLADGNILQLEYHEHLPSVSDIAKEYAKKGSHDRYVVFSERTDNDAREGIYMSVILHPSIFPSQAVFVGPAAAVATATALQEHTARSIGIGWISDIYCDSDRMGSIWVEGKLDSYTSYEYLIINFHLPLEKGKFPPRLTDMIRKVFESESASISMLIAKNILGKFFSLYADIKSPQKIMNSYKNLFAQRGARIKCAIDGNRKVTCKVLGVDNSSCALIVEERGGKVSKVTTQSGISLPRKLNKRSVPQKS